jgi:hypothetical protein
MVPNRQEGLQAQRKSVAQKDEPSGRTTWFPPLEEESREVVPTACAAYHVNRAPQTLRGWACLGKGLLSPVHLGSRLGWRTADIRRLVQEGTV